MISLKLRGVIDSETKEKYFRLINDHRRYANKVDALCRCHFNKKFKEIVLMSPDELQNFVYDFDKKNEATRLSIKEAFTSMPTEKGKNSNYVVDTIYGKMPDEARKIIYEVADIKTCPYCNRNYIDIVQTKGKSYKSTFDLDHFYSKSDYPMLAVSLYNLLPTCPACNRIKGTNAFQYYPYCLGDDVSDAMQFSYDIVNAKLSNDNDVRVKIRCKNDNVMIERQKLYLQELYENHKDIAFEIIRKARFQGEGYMKSLHSQLQKLFPDKAEIYRLIYGNYLNRNDWNKRPLSKFTYDIARETLEVYGILIEQEYGD